MKGLVRSLFAIVSVAVILLSGHAYAASVTAVPTAWRLQNYVVGNDPNGVATFYTGSSCASGQLLFRPDVNIAVVDRYWSLVMSAKISRQLVTVFYTVEGSDCRIDSFLLQEE